VKEIASNFLICGNYIFACGFVGTLFFRRNLLLILMSLELIFLGASLFFVGISYLKIDSFGAMCTLFLLSIATGETAIGLGLIVKIYQANEEISLENFSKLSG